MPTARPMPSPKKPGQENDATGTLRPRRLAKILSIILIRSASITLITLRQAPNVNQSPELSYVKSKITIIQAPSVSYYLAKRCGERSVFGRRDRVRAARAHSSAAEDRRPWAKASGMGAIEPVLTIRSAIASESTSQSCGSVISSGILAARAGHSLSKTFILPQPDRRAERTQHPLCSRLLPCHEVPTLKIPRAQQTTEMDVPVLMLRSWHHFWARSNRRRSASGSSAWATSACRWLGRSATMASRYWGSTSTRSRSPGSSAGELYRAYLRRGHRPDAGKRVRGHGRLSAAG